MKYLFLVFLIILAPSAYADTVGPSFPTTAVYQNNGDGWTNPTAVEANDGVPAIATPHGSANDTSGDLFTEGYGFAVPAGATINGITATVSARAATAGEGSDYMIFLLRGGSEVGSNLANNIQMGTATTTVTYGGPSNLWGTTWTPSQINASNFGINLNYTTAIAGILNIYVDYVTLTVNYTLNNNKFTMWQFFTF